MCSDLPIPMQGGLDDSCAVDPLGIMERWDTLQAGKNID